MQEELLDRHALELASLRRAENRVRVLLLATQQTQRESDEAYHRHTELVHQLLDAQAALKAAIERERIARENAHTARFE